jgi:hypothetical protein
MDKVLIIALFLICAQITILIGLLFCFRKDKPLPQLIVPTQVQTKEGEITVRIALDLNINLTGNGLSISAKQIEAKEEEKTEWAIPEFKPAEKVRFGK